MKKAEVMKLGDAYLAEMLKEKEEFLKVKADVIDKIKTASYDEAHEIINSLNNSIGIITKGAGVVLEGVSTPSFLTSIKTYNSGDKLSSVSLTIKTRLKADFPYKETFEFAADESLVANIYDAYARTLIQMLYIEIGGKNIIKLNDYIAEVCDSEGIPFKFRFTISDHNSYVVSIDDNEVVFNSTLDSALDVDGLPFFSGGDEYCDRVASIARQGLVDSLKSLQSTVQIIKSGIPVINIMTSIKTKKRADRLIRQSYHKKATNFNTIKSGGYGYFEKTVEIDGEEVNIFSILKKDSEGNISVSLSPFDIKTLFTVDYDVVADVKEAIKA